MAHGAVNDFELPFDGSMARAVESGGSILVEKTGFGGSRYAAISDSGGFRDRDLGGQAWLS